MTTKFGIIVDMSKDTKTTIQKETNPNNDTEKDTNTNTDIDLLNQIFDKLSIQWVRFLYLFKRIDDLCI
jgi:hypothetical protein